MNELLRVIPSQALTTDAQDAITKKDNILKSLGSFCLDKWNEAKTEKEYIENAMLEDLMQCNGEYKPDVMSAIKEVNSSEVFAMITDTKVRTAYAWIDENIIQQGRRVWTIEPTPIPDLPAYIQEQINREIIEKTLQVSQQISQAIGQVPSTAELKRIMSNIYEEIRDNVVEEIRKEAFKMADKMADKIDDQLSEGGFYKALPDLIKDIIRLRAGFIKGPIYRREKIKKIDRNPLTGKLEKKVEERIIPTYERRSPFNLYPEPGSTDIDDGYLIDVLYLSRKQLYELIGLEGYDEVEIRKVITEYDNGNLDNWLFIDSSVRANSGTYGDNTLGQISGKIQCLEFWGDVQGSMLLEYGMTDTEISDPDASYPICCWNINGHIIKAMLNYDEFGKKPFSKTSFEKVPDQFWGKSLPQTIKDPQSICNSTARAIQNNTAIASGPQVEVNIDRLDDPDDVTLIPWQVWKCTGDDMSASPALRFYQPKMVCETLINVFNTFSRVADEHSGIPAYAHGASNIGGAGSALANYEKVLTPSGPVPISELEIGDQVVNIAGGFSKVTGVFPQGETDIFRMKFNNGSSIDCDMNHRWSVKSHQDRSFRVLTTEEILEKGLFRKTIVGYRNPSGWRPKWMLPIIDRIEFSKRKIKIDPYTMGALIGDGDARCRLTSEDKEIFDRIPYPLGKVDNKHGEKAYSRTIKGKKVDYLSYGLDCKSINKFIPDDYLFNTRQVRLELLRGLMDTDGCAPKDGGIFFSTSSKRLANDFVKLVRSLGGIVTTISEGDGGNFTIRGRECTRKKTYRIVFNLSHEKVFHLERKQSRVKTIPKTHTFITGVEYVGRGEATCISVDSKDSLFVCENFIPTHNTASGFDMLLAQSARGIKQLIKSIDMDIFAPVLERQYEINIEDEELFSLVGDFRIVAKGYTNFVTKQAQTMRKMELLPALNNPVDMQILGLEGRKEQIRDVFKSLDLDTEGILPEKKQIAHAPPPAAQNMPPTGGPQTLDAAGNPVVGQDARQFNPQNPTGQVSTPGNAGTANMRTN